MHTQDHPDEILTMPHPVLRLVTPPAEKPAMPLPTSEIPTYLGAPMLPPVARTRYDRPSRWSRIRSEIAVVGWISAATAVSVFAFIEMAAR